MKEWGLLFSAPMAKAVVEGRKIQTRRLDERLALAKPGDVLWGKETWATISALDMLAPSDMPTHAPVKTPIFYLADGRHQHAGKTRVSIHMCRWMSRIVTPIVSVRIEPLWSITDEDAKAEGARFHDGRGVGHSGWRLDEKDVYPTPRDAFLGLWAQLHGNDSLRANPRVVRVQFEPLKPTGGEAAR